MEESGQPDKSIARRDLASVVRRAAELAAVAEDSTDKISEEEVIRIAGELGLAPRHVRQALYEGGQADLPETFLDRHFTPPRISSGRAVQLSADNARRALEDYLVTYEYLQVVRRHGDTTTFEPASDTVSKVVRAFQRSSKHQLARAQHVDMTIRTLEEGWSHIRLRALFRDERKGQLVGVGIGSFFLGVPGGAAMGAIVGGLFGTFTGTEGAIIAGVLTGITTFGAIAAGLFSSAKSSYRRWRERTDVEAEALLDRIEKNTDLRPPPAPWMRKLQSRLGRL